MNDTKILPSNEYTEFEDRVYLNPNLRVDETNTFIDNLRNTRNNNLQEIAQQTQALGTDVPSSIGGLTGAGSYFTSRYATPQSSSLSQNLRTTAQAAALNQALANEQAMWKKRYNEAYRNYQKRSWDKQNSVSGGGSDGGTEGVVEYEDDYDGMIEGNVPGAASGYTTVMPDTDNDTVIRYDYVPYGGEGTTQHSYYPGQTSTVSASVVRRHKKEGDITKGNNRSGTISVWKLPDGTSTNVDATYYVITKDAQGNYYAKDRSTGELTLIK